MGFRVMTLESLSLTFSEFISCSSNNPGNRSQFDQLKRGIHTYTFPLTNLNKVSYNFVYKYTILVWTLIHFWTSPKKGKSLGCPRLIKQRRIRNICLTGFPCPWWWRRRRHEEIWRAACPATSRWGEASSRTAPGSPGSPWSLQRPLPCFKFCKVDVVVNISEIPEMCKEQMYSDSVHGTLPKIHISYLIHRIFLSISICHGKPIHRCTFLTLHFSSPQCQVCGRLWQIDRQLFDIFCCPDRAVLFKTGPKKKRSVFTWWRCSFHDKWLNPAGEGASQESDIGKQRWWLSPGHVTAGKTGKAPPR